MPFDIPFSDYQPAKRPRLPRRKRKMRETKPQRKPQGFFTDEQLAQWRLDHLRRQGFVSERKTQ